MYKLFLNNIRNLKQIVLQFIAILILVSLTVLLVGALFSTNFQLASYENDFLSKSPYPQYKMRSNMVPKFDAETEDWEGWDDNKFRFTYEAQQFLPAPYKNMSLDDLLKYNWGLEIPKNVADKDKAAVEKLKTEYHNAFLLYIFNQIMQTRLQKTYHPGDMNFSFFPWLTINGNNSLSINLQITGNFAWKGTGNENKVFHQSSSASVVLKGRAPTNDHEILLAYGQGMSSYSKLHIGDEIKINSPNELKFTIVGYAASSTDDLFLNKWPIDTYHFITTAPNVFNLFLDPILTHPTKIKKGLKFGWNNYIRLNDNSEITPFYNVIRDVFNVYNINPDWLVNKTPSNVFTEGIKYIFILYFSVGLLIILVVGLLLSFFVVNQVNYFKTQIGVLKAIGYSTKQLVTSFVALIGCITFFSAIIGYIGSLFLQNYILGAIYDTLPLPLHNFYFSPEVFIGALIIIPLLLIGIVAIKVYQSLKLSPIALLRGNNAISSPFWMWVRRKTNGLNKRLWFKFRIGTAIVVQQINKLFFAIPIFMVISVLVTFQLILNDMNQSTIANYRHLFVHPDTVISYSMHGQPYYYKDSDDVSNPNVEINLDAPKFNWETLKQAKNEGAIIDPKTDLEPLYINNELLDHHQLTADLVEKLMNHTCGKWRFTNWASVQIENYKNVNGYYPNINFGTIFYDDKTTYLSHSAQITFKKDDFKFRGFHLSTITKSNYQKFYNWNISTSTAAKFFVPAGSQPKNNLGKKENPIPLLISRRFATKFPELNNNKLINLNLNPYYANLIPNLFGQVVGVVPNMIFNNEVYIANQNFEQIVREHIFPPSSKPIFSNSFVTQEVPNYSTHNLTLNLLYDNKKGEEREIYKFDNLITKASGSAATNFSFNNNVSLPNLAVNFGYSPTDRFKLNFNSSQSSVSRIFVNFTAIVVIQTFLGLIIIIDIILTVNKRFVLVLKVLGYNIREATSLIVSYYLIFILISYVGGIAISYGIGKLMQFMVLKMSSFSIALPVNWITIVITLAVILGILLLAYLASIWFIRRIPINRLSFEE